MWSIIIVFILVGSYMGIKSYAKSELTSRLNDYYGETNQMVLVTTPAENLIDTKKPFRLSQMVL